MFFYYIEENQNGKWKRVYGPFSEREEAFGKAITGEPTINGTVWVPYYYINDERFKVNLLKSLKR